MAKTPARKKKSSKKKRHVERPDLRATLLDAAETLFREEGYASATARRIASKVGLKHQAVFYYFGSQDELLLALLRRSSDAHRERLVGALNSEKPVRAIWDVISDPDNMRLSLEFMALGIHNEAIRKALAENAEAVRKLEAEAVAKHLEARGVRPLFSPNMVSILTNAMARLLVQESTLGITIGHEEVERLVEGSLSHFEQTGGVAEFMRPLVDAMSE
jgi:AcrR family transcriptional regulator